MEPNSKNAVSIAKMFLDHGSHQRAAAILNALLAQIEAARPGRKTRLTADDWRRFGEILVLSDVETSEQLVENGMREAAKPRPAVDPMHEEPEDADEPFPSVVQRGPVAFSLPERKEG